MTDDADGLAQHPDDNQSGAESAPAVRLDQLEIDGVAKYLTQAILYWLAIATMRNEPWPGSPFGQGSLWIQDVVTVTS